MELFAYHSLDQMRMMKEPYLYSAHDKVFVEEKRPPWIVRLFRQWFQGCSNDPSLVLASLYKFTREAKGPQKEIGLYLLEGTLKKSAQKLKISPKDAEGISELVRECAEKPVLSEEAPQKSLALRVKLLNPLARMSKALPKQSELALSIGAVQEKLSVIKTWTSLGLDPSLLKTDYEGAHFLVKERLIYSIVGFQNTSQHGERQKLKVDAQGKISILVNSTYTPVSELRGIFTYDKNELQLIHKDTKKAWNYFCTVGLTEIDRCTSKEYVPVTTLSRGEMKSLLEQANKFDQPLPLGEKTCVLQIVTNPRKGRRGPQTPLLHGLDFLTPVHVSFRLIDSDGAVYSGGFASTAQEDSYNQGRGNLLTTINGVPSILDYEEFRQHSGRLVTSVPVTQKTFTALLDEVKKMRTQTVRFNILRQNCSAMAVELLNKAGVNMDNRLHESDLARIALPSLANYPFMQKSLKKLISIWDYLEQKAPILKEARGVIYSVISLALTPVRILAHLVTNLFLLTLGAGKGSPMPENKKPYEGKFLHPIRSEILSFGELFSANPTIVPHSGPVIKWQLEQATTEVCNYTGPKMDILPSKGSKAPLPATMKPYTNVLFVKEPMKSYATEKLTKFGKILSRIHNNIRQQLKKEPKP